MKKKIFMLLAMVMTVMTASAVDAPSFSLTKADGAEAHGQISFIVGENQNATTAKEGETVTVVLTPDRGWDLGTASGRWYAAMAKAPRRAGDIDLLDNLTLTPVTGQTNQWTFTMQRANAEVNFTYKKLMDNEDITVTIGDATYTGQPLTPTVTVKDGNTVLTEGTVYTLSYSNNTDAGLSTAGDKAPSVTITAKSSDGQYAGSVTKTFTIQKAAATISYETASISKTYGDEDFTNPLTVTGDGSVTYSSDNESVATVNSESGLVHIVGSGNANITATVADGNNFTYAVKTAQYAVTVSKAAATISYETASLSKTYGDEDFTNPLTIMGDGSVTYASDNESVATVNSESGLVHIVGSGNANITATVADGNNFTYAVKTAQYAIGVNTAAMTVSANGYTGTYDGQSHTITVTVTEPEGTTVKYGTKAGEYTMDEAPAYTDAGEYTVFYQVTKENYTTVEGSATVSIAKAAATISYETASLSKTYEDEDFTNPLTNRGDGSVTYASDNESVATVNSESGLVHIVGSGNANITATVADSKNFTYAVKTAQYAIGVNTAAMTVSANGYTGTYDGQSHTITVTVTEPEGTTVKYGTNAGEYTMDEAPAYTDAGEYTVFYQVTKENYTTVVASAIVTIQKAAATISYATTRIGKTFGDEAFTNELTMTGDGTATFSSSDEDVATVDAETGEVTILSAGTATITAYAADGTNYAYDPNSASYELTVGNATMTVTSEGWTGVYDGEEHSITVNAPEGARIKYGRSEDGCNLTRKPTYTNSGTYTCYYEVTMDSYTPVYGHETVTIKKAAGAISFEAESVKKAKGDAAFTNPLTNTGDGVVSYDTSDSKIARVNATTGEVTIGKNEGTATITATVKDGPNYDYAVKTATYTVVVGEGGEEPGGDEPGDEPGPEPGGDDVIVINADANEAGGDNDKVDGVKFNVAVDKNAQSRQEERTFVDPVTGETVTKTVTIVPITLESIIIPQQEGASATDKQGIVVTIPPYVEGPDGIIYEITSIAAGAFVSNEPTAVITTVVLPDTEKPLTLEPGCMDNGTGESMRVIAPLQHLDDYALNTALASSYEALKVSAMVTPPNRYWSFSCGVDVLVPVGVSVYTAHVNSDKEVVITQIPEDKLTVDGEQIIMANNGVLVACTDGSNGDAYEIVANPGRQKSGTPIATNDAKSYGQDNQLEPVIEQKNYAASDYYVLVDNEFHPILYNNSKVSACKAVLKYTGGSANARLIITEGNNSPTGIDSMVNGQCSMVNGSIVNVYDLNGREVQTPAKGGVYIINNKKVVIKK